MAMPKREPLEKICIVCETPFLTGGRGRPRVGQAMCSVACQRASRFRRSSQANEMSVADAAYLAGIVDGEGSIMLLPRATDSVHICLTVSNTFMGLHDWIMKTTGVGGLYRHQRASELHKPAFSWRSNGDGAESALLQIRPHLVIKTKQADLALEHHSWLRDPAKKADREWQQMNLHAMRAMNKRGVAIPE